MKNTLKLLSGSLALAATMLFSPAAEAGIEACGDIHVEAGAECELVAEGGCVAQCEPIAFKAACAAEGTIECSGGCTLEAEAQCGIDCSGSCVADCELDPPAFECAASCQADCEGSCSGACEGDADGAGCMASCEATCSGECDAQCTLEPGEADCNAQCDQCCSGSCTASANLDCQVSCQSDLRASCEAELQGGCEVSCEEPEGALFCDGNYVDHGDNLAECAAALQAAFGITIEGYANADCDGNSCEAEAGFNCAASVNPERTSPAGFLWFLAGAGLLVAGTRRRR